MATPKCKECGGALRTDSAGTYCPNLGATAHLLAMERAECSGYRPCACRDCMETAIGLPGALCHACETAGCEPGKECQAPDAYGSQDNEGTEG